MLMTEDERNLDTIKYGILLPLGSLPVIAAASGILMLCAQHNAPPSLITAGLTTVAMTTLAVIYAAGSSFKEVGRECVSKYVRDTFKDATNCAVRMWEKESTGTAIVCGGAVYFLLSVGATRTSAIAAGLATTLVVSRLG